MPFFFVIAGEAVDWVGGGGYKPECIEMESKEGVCRRWGRGLEGNGDGGLAWICDCGVGCAGRDRFVGQVVAALGAGRRLRVVMQFVCLFAER